MSRIRVGVLRGGPGSEYDVSLKTGASVLEALPKDAYEPLDIFIDKQGTWHLRGMPLPPERAARQADVIFNALHGQYGEDGTVQQILDAAGVPYTGSGALASAIGMNKALTKDRLKDSGIKLPRQRLLSVSDTLHDEVLDIFRTFPQPSVVKPVSAGSSVGVTIARSFQELWDGVKKAFEHSPKVLVEEFIQGKEATAGVVEGFRGKDIYQLLPIEIVPAPDRPFFDYQAKYEGASEERVPGNFTKEETQELQRLAALVHKELGLKHYSRSDFIISPRGIYFLEVNTLPDLRKDSLIAKSLSAVGTRLSDFFSHVITLAHGRS